jgi:hypothetical protein
MHGSLSFCQKPAWRLCRHTPGWSDAERPAMPGDTACQLLHMASLGALDYGKPARRACLFTATRSQSILSCQIMARYALERRRAL